MGGRRSGAVLGALLAAVLVVGAYAFGRAGTGSAGAAPETAAAVPSGEAGMAADRAAWPMVHTDTPAQTRTYYISADEVAWDYAPDGLNRITGEPFDPIAATWVEPGPDRIGSRYTKCLYRAYTDATYTQPAAPPERQGPLGFLGPVIRAQVGDVIVVEFRNACPFPASVHPHGVFYTKSSEGAPYDDGTAGADKADDAVAPGGTHTYTWPVPERAGPGPMDGSSVMWMYHSHTDEVRDTYSGLMGAMVVTAQGHARADGSPADVDREELVLYSVMNENKSYYLLGELAKLAEPPEDPDGDDGFTESNLMHSVNGYVFGNGPVPAMRVGEHVRWYVMSMGTEVDLHTPHWHGNTVLALGMRMDTVSLLPAQMVVADMVPDNPGTWLFHCHVNDHLTAGMVSRYQVTA